MMQLRLGLIAAFSIFGLAGCGSFALNNGSLNYKQTTQTEALKYPEGAVFRPATPLYPTPTIDQLALDNAPQVENKYGNRFEIPKPPVELGQVHQNVTTQTGALEQIIDGNQNPLLKIDGNSDTIWQYTLATLSSLNHNIVNQNANRYEATVNLGQQNYVLKLSSVGSSNRLAVFNPDNSFADPQVAATLLAQIYQNWPA